MKKFINIVLVALLCCSTLMFTGCSGAVVPTGEKQPPIISPEVMDKNLKEFLQISPTNPDGVGGTRCYTSESATNAAQLLYNKYTAPISAENPNKVYENISVMPLADTKFELEFSQTNKVIKRDAYNVVLRYKSKTAKNSEQVIIGACYDNSFGDPEQDTIGATSLGAIENATGVATLMSIADYLNQNPKDYGFDIVMCFFAGAYGSTGSLNYVTDIMLPEQRLNTLMMFNLYRLGGERTYIYSDEVSTKANEFLFDQGAKQGLEFYKMPRYMPIIEKQYINKVPYLHWGMIGDHAPFMVHEMPVANFVGGYYGGMNVANLEEKGSANLGSTKEDTYSNLVKYRDGYASSMSDAATLILTSMQNSEFTSVMNLSKNTVFDYSFWANPLWAELIALGIIVLAIVLVIVLVKYFEKKYPYKPVVKKLKIAVFGLDYETKNPEDIFIDIKKKRDPFSGY